jgi:hypothetical protein
MRSLAGRSSWTALGGLSPLHFAARGGHGAVVEVLLDNGANVNAESDDGMTPLNQVWGDDRMKSLLERRGGRRATVGRLRTVGR